MNIIRDHGAFRQDPARSADIDAQNHCLSADSFVICKIVMGESDVAFEILSIAENIRDKLNGPLTDADAYTMRRQVQEMEDLADKL